MAEKLGFLDFIEHIAKSHSHHQLHAPLHGGDDDGMGMKTLQGHVPGPAKVEDGLKRLKLSENIAAGTRREAVSTSCGTPGTTERELGVNTPESGRTGGSAPDQILQYGMGAGQVIRD